MNNSKQPLDDSVNREENDDEIQNLKSLPIYTKSYDKVPIRTASIKTKDSQIQIVRRNIGEEPVYFIFYRKKPLICSKG